MPAGKRFFGTFLFCLVVVLGGAKSAEVEDFPTEPPSSKLSVIEVLTREDCLRETKENHPDLIAAKESLRQTKLDKGIAVTDYLPQISGSASGRTAEASTGVTTDTYAYSVSGSQLVFDSFKTNYEIAEAVEDVRAAQYSYDVTSSQIRLNLMTAFSGLLRAQELVVITEEIASRRRQNTALVKLRYEGGREHRGSLLNAEANLAQAEFEVVQSKRNIDLAQRRLLKELGREEMAPLRVRGDFIVKNAEREKPDFQELAENAPFLQRLIAQKEAARYNLKSTNADFFPQVYASGSAGKSSSHWPPEGTAWSAGLTVSVPIFEGGSKLLKSKKAESALEEAKEDERSGRDSVLFTLEDTWINLQDALDNVGVRKKFLEATEERAKIAQEQYSNGLLSFDNWSIIEDDLVSTRKSLLNAQDAALVAEATWIQAKGGILDYDE